MSLLKYVERLKRIDELIQRKNTGNATEFAGKLGISRSQLLQDLKEYRELGANVAYDAFRRSYYYPEQKFILILNAKSKNVRGGATVAANNRGDTSSLEQVFKVHQTFSFSHALENKIFPSPIPLDDDIASYDCKSSMLAEYDLPRMPKSERVGDVNNSLKMKKTNRIQLKKNVVTKLSNLALAKVRGGDDDTVFRSVNTYFTRIQTCCSDACIPN
jgi:hypothetical protein